MTPDKARDLLDGTTPGDEWYYRIKGGGVLYVEPITVIFGEVDVTEEDAALIVAAPDMAAMIAGMRTEYQVQRQFAGEWYPCQLGLGMTWTEDQTVADEYADTCRARSIPVRIVRHYVTAPEEA